MARLFAVLMVGTFFLFINLAAALFSQSNTATSPLAPTVVLFQLIADVVFVIGFFVLVAQSLRKLNRRASVNRAMPPRAQATIYQHDATPFTGQDTGWRIVGARPAQTTWIDPQLTHHQVVHNVQGNERNSF